jgi:hypothetical protein
MENNDPFRILEEENDKESHLIENLEKKLYSRQEEVKSKDRTILRPKRFSQTESWTGSLDYTKPEQKSGLSLFVRFFLFSLVFFVIAAGIAGYSLFNKRIVVSPDNVSVSVFGPVSVKGGEELPVQVLIENKNTVGLNSVQLTTDFPDGTRYVSNPGQKLERIIKPLGVVDPAEVRTETMKALVFGKENEKKVISFSVRFRIEGSDAVFTKTKKFQVGLTTPPLTFTVSTLGEATPGQDLNFDVNLKSNSPAPLGGELFRIDYPAGFVFKSSNPAPSFNDNIWLLGDMNLGDVKNISIVGTLLGENDQRKVFHLTSGVGTDKDKYTIGTIFGDSETTVTIKKPFLGINMFVNRTNTPNPVIDAWDVNTVNVNWINTLKNKIVDAEIEIGIEGSVVNKKTVTPQDDGLYDSFKNTIFWDKRVEPNLESIPPGGKGTVLFTFDLTPYSAEHRYKNPVITLSASVKGKRIDENSVPEEIKFISSKKVKISTQMNFVSIGRYYDTSIKNRGPLPPKIGQETTYTITWRMKNTVNSVSGAEVTASIPLSVRWTGEVFPTGAPVSYNPTSHKVTWKLGDVKEGRGYVDEPAEVSFQVGLLPGLSQRAKSPQLLSESVLNATDDFTGSNLSVTSRDISTIIDSMDPKAGQEDTIVVE